MLLGGRRMQQPTIDGSGEGDGQPVLERQGSGQRQAKVGVGVRGWQPATKVSTITRWRVPTNNVDGR